MPGWGWSHDHQRYPTRARLIGGPSDVLMSDGCVGACPAIALQF